MKKIDISTKKFPNTFTLVDDSDCEELNKYKWHAHEPKENKLYAQRGIKANGKWTTLLMHVAILGSVNGKEIDHRNGITLDNQRSNLRHCTQAENAKNRKINANNKCGFKGVCWEKGANKWRSQIRLDGKVIHLGLFTCLIKAATAYDSAANKYHGEFARLNFP